MYQEFPDFWKNMGRDRVLLAAYSKLKVSGFPPSAVATASEDGRLKKRR